MTDRKTLDELISSARPPREITLRLIRSMRDENESHERQAELIQQSGGSWMAVRDRWWRLQDEVRAVWREIVLLQERYGISDEERDADKVDANQAQRCEVREG